MSFLKGSPWRAVRSGLDCSGILTVVVPLAPAVSAREIGRAWGDYEIAVLTPCSPGPLGTAAEPLQCSTWQIVDRLGYSSQFLASSQASQAARVRRGPWCARRLQLKPVSMDWGGNNAAEHRISGSAGSTGLAPWGIRSLLTARYRVLPEIPVFCHIDCHQQSTLTVPSNCTQDPESPRPRGST